MQSVPLTGVPVFSSKNVCRGAKRPRSRAHLHLGRFRIARAASDDLEIVAVAEHVLCRTPHGVRGLKSTDTESWGKAFASHPARGAWIEMVAVGSRSRHSACRAPHGARGLKCVPKFRAPAEKDVAPHGVRGLKFDHRAGLLFPNRRAPRRTPPTADAPDCKCSPGRSYKRKACSAERTRSEARGHRRATGEEVP